MSGTCSEENGKRSLFTHDYLLWEYGYDFNLQSSWGGKNVYICMQKFLFFLKKGKDLLNKSQLY